MFVIGIHVIPSHSTFLNFVELRFFFLWPLFFFLRRTLFSKKNLAKVASAQSTRVEAKRTGKHRKGVADKGGTKHRKSCLAPCHIAGTANGQLFVNLYIYIYISYTYCFIYVI